MSLITVERDSAQHRRLKLAGLAVLALLAIAVPFFFGPFRVSQFTLALIYAIAVLGLNLLVGYVGLLGVRRPWRRKGLGEALLLRSFQAFRERGWTRGTLGVDASSPTGATRLYERAGMRVYRTTVFLERPVRG